MGGWETTVLSNHWVRGHVHEYDTPGLAEPVAMIWPPYSSLAGLLCTCKRIIVLGCHYISLHLRWSIQVLTSSQRATTSASSNYVRKYWSDFFFSFSFSCLDILKNYKVGNSSKTFFPPSSLILHLKKMDWKLTILMMLSHMIVFLGCFQFFDLPWWCFIDFCCSRASLFPY